jgi:hypothetical protein
MKTPKQPPLLLLKRLNPRNSLFNPSLKLRTDPRLLVKINKEDLPLISLLVETSRLLVLKRRPSEEETEVAEVATEETEVKAKKVAIEVTEAKVKKEPTEATEEKAKKADTAEEEKEEKEEKVKKVVAEVAASVEAEVATAEVKIEVKVNPENSEEAPEVKLEAEVEAQDLIKKEKMSPLIKLMLMKLRYINSVKNMLTGKERDKDTQERDTNPTTHTTERVVLVEV